ncbi:MAG: NAD(P)/FAD-dependent oxidoreductase [Bacteroidota bacterium]
MTRQEFLQRSTALGIGLPLLSNLLLGCEDEVLFKNDFEVNFSGKVLIIGAGAAGMTAGHVLNKYGIDFEIVEAAAGFGGRVKKIENFADFPIDLGAEWIHDKPSILAKLISDDRVNANVELIDYSPETIYLWKNDKLKKRNFFSNFYGEYKFKDTTWFDFFERHIVPGIADRTVFNSPIVQIDYSKDKIVATTTNGHVFQADKLILTVPLTILKQNRIAFTPAFPQQKVEALKGVDMPDGIKVFIEFSERFYPDITFDGGLFENLNDDKGAKTYYDAAFRKDTNKNVLGLFAVGIPATPYTRHETEEEIVQYVLDELDKIFDGKASKFYVKHIVQNWSKESYILGSYSHYVDYNVRDELRRPIDGKIYFAGETYSPDENAIATVHGAGLSAYVAVEDLLKNESI